MLEDVASTERTTFVIAYVIFEQPRSRVIALVTDASRQTEWRTDLKSVAVVEDAPPRRVDEVRMRVMFRELVYRVRYHRDPETDRIAWALDERFETSSPCSRASGAGAIVLLFACSPPKSEPVKTVSIADGEIDPAKWGQAYPLEYDRWKMPKDPKPAGKSKYKKGYDTDKVIYDKLSEYPYLVLLYHGWGFGIEYNEARGHHYMLIDQLEIDPSRVGAGGVCLSCKTPYAAKLEKELGAEYFSMKYIDAHAMIPKEPQELGVACIECHDNKTMGLRLYHPAALVGSQRRGGA